MLLDDVTLELEAAEPPPGEEPEPPPDPWTQAELNKLVAELRLLGARYRDVETALEDGFAPEGGCLPGRGLHYVRDVPAGVSGLDARDPNVLVYAPSPGGHLRLAAVAFAAAEAAGATLLGVPLVAPGESGLPFWSLHVWVGQGKPRRRARAGEPHRALPGAPAGPAARRWQGLGGEPRSAPGPARGQHRAADRGPRLARSAAFPAVTSCRPDGQDLPRPQR